MGRLEHMVFTVPPDLLKFITPEIPKPLRLNAARGTLPLPPRDLLVAVFALSRDPDEEISQTSHDTLAKTPPAMLKGVLSDPNAHPLMLDYFARNLPYDSELQEVVALNKTTDDETVAFQSTLRNKKLVDIISNNQIRMLRSPFIVDKLAENPLASASLLDRIIKFMELETTHKPEKSQASTGEGMEVESEEAAEEAPPEPDEVTTYDSGEVSAVTMDGEEVENAWAKLTFNSELVADKKFEKPEEQEEEEKTLASRILNMSVSEKIKLAMMGNLTARNILVRDSNKLVSSAVLKSPRITDSEIEALSQNKSVAEDVIRQIAHSKEYTRSYSIKLNLVNNSKTPVGESLRFLNHLHDKDLAGVAKSKNVSQPVQIAAKKLLETREKANQHKKKK